MKSPQLRSPLLVLLFALGLSACASRPASEIVVDSSTSTEKQIGVVSQELMDLRNDSNAHLLAAEPLSRAETALDRARELRSQKKSDRETLRQVGLARAWARDARIQSHASRDPMEPVLNARRFADTAQASRIYPERWESADARLQRVSARIARGRLPENTDDLKTLERVYAELESDAAVESRLAPLRETIQQAKREGAARLAPQSLEAAEKQLEDSRRIIAGSPRDLPLTDQAVRAVEDNVNRLVTVLARVRDIRSVSPEDGVIAELQRESRIQAEQERQQDEIRALQEENLDAHVGRLSAELRAAALEATIAANQEALAERLEELRADLGGAASDAGNADSSEFSANAAEVRRHFSLDEADVVPEGRTLVIRLKNLEFAHGDDVVPPESFDLLRRVGESLELFNDKFVVVEGHVNSAGSEPENMRISESRARAVLRFLSDHFGLDPEGAEAIGYGGSRPAEDPGRGPDERIEIVIETY